MNKRIKELAEQAYEDVIKNTPSFLVTKELYEQKFADLIVKEMLVTCEEHPAWTGRMISEEIKQRFGVKE